MAAMQRLLIIGFGDIAQRAASKLAKRYRLYAITRHRENFALIRALGATPIQADLDEPDSLRRLAGLAQHVLHLAPPQPSGTDDRRTARLLAALGKGKSLPQRLLYISTSGVYGDCGGKLVTEVHPKFPATDRARRRVAAERRVRTWAGRNGCAASILRVPGIYAEGRLPLDRLRAGTPALEAEADTYTNHIHADDLAQIIIAALCRGRPQRAYHASDDSRLKMGDYFDRVADAARLPRPPRIPLEKAYDRLTPVQLSFMKESRRLDNSRMKRELRITLSYPDVDEGLKNIQFSVPADQDPVGSSSRR